MITKKPEIEDIPEPERSADDDVSLEFFDPWDSRFNNDFKTNEREFEF